MKALLLGKFLPFHLGHYNMIKYAIENYGDCVVVVFSRNGENWDGELRKQWIDESFPNNPQLTTLHIPMDYCDPYDDHSWLVWANTIKSIGQGVTHFVSSENYGFEVAKQCGWVHDLYDKERIITSVCGTNLRNDPIKYWNFLPPATKKSLIKKIAIVGAESTGKSTLAVNLSKIYSANYVEEYGREYCLYKDLSAFTERDLRAIYHEQKRREDKQSSVSPSGVLFCDTDVLVTRAWSKHLFGYDCLDGVIGDYDFYAITNPKNCWHQDGTRVCEDQKVRENMTSFIVQEIQKQNKRFIQLPLGFEDATKTLINLMDTMYPSLRN